MTQQNARIVRRVSRAARFLAVAAALAPAPARAQIGSGWTRLVLDDDYIDTQSMGKHARHPVGVSFTTSGARYTSEGDTETFELYDPSFNRVERDSNHHYRTGKVQFEGIVQIYPGVNHQFIVQNFNAAGSGPIMALSAFSRNNGTIVKQGGSVEVATNIFGKDVRVNIIHDLDANTLAVYIDGVRAWQGAGGLGGGGFNFKYGSYGSLNGSTSAKARWKNVQFFTGGTVDGGSGPEPTADAGARDMAAPADAEAGPDGGMPGDGGGREGGGTGGSGPVAPDAGGSGGAGGSAGPGAGGSGGGGGGAGGGAGGGGRGGAGPRSGGRGGSAGPVDQPADPGGCGCRLGGGLQGSGGALGFAGLIGLWVVRRGRARRGTALKN